ncbi:MAG: hypothetical protein ONA90_02570, partial [candidate division KSB1 bacterium]|nr:hypothetical protein [candidate division KSB1 bacterium]
MARQTASVTQKIILLYNLAASWTRDEKKEVRQFADKMLEGLEQQGYFVQPVEVDDDLSVLDPYDPFEWLVFNWCESLGELHASEVLVAKELETRGYAFTGSPSKILKLNYDKWQVKKILRAAKIPTPPGRIMEAEVEAEEWEYFPAIVKPAYQHCSIGITRDSLVETREALIRQVRLIYGEYDQPSLVEPFIDGREFHTAVWGNRKIEALPPVELNFSSFADWRER